MGIKLIFIGEDNIKNFKYNNKVFRPYYLFGEKYKIEEITPYLISCDEPFNYQDFIDANNKVGNKPANIYACLSEPQGNYYIPVSANKICKFNIEKLTDTTLVQEQEQSSIIPNEYIIKTQNENIVKMMQLKGCKIMKNNKDYFITKEETLEYIKNNFNRVKKFRDDINITSFKPDLSKDKQTETGIEGIVNICINRRIHCEATKVYSLKINRAYLYFIYNNELFFIDQWFDPNTGEIENSPKHQSLRPYIWSIQ